MTTPILLLMLLFSGWLLSLTRRGWVARTLVIVSVPVGAFLGGYFGYTFCRLVVFPFDGRPESQHNWIGWIDAGLFGAGVGLIILSAIALAITKKTKDEKDVA